MTGFILVFVVLWLGLFLCILFNDEVYSCICCFVTRFILMRVLWQGLFLCVFYDWGYSCLCCFMTEFILMYVLWSGLLLIIFTYTISDGQREHLIWWLISLTIWFISWSSLGTEPHGILSKLLLRLITFCPFKYIN